MRRRWALSVSLLLLVALPLAAAPRDAAKPVRQESQVGSGILDRLLSLFGDLRSMFADARSSMDPDGGSTPPAGPTGYGIPPSSSTSAAVAPGASAGLLR